MIAKAISKEFNNTLKDFRIGTRYGRGILFRVPSFDCDWYWGFGYLGNSQCHFHLDGLAVMDEDCANLNMFDQLKKFFGDSLTITDDKDLWKFCELSKTIYTLKSTAELFHRGGSHYTSNPDANSIKNPEIENHINCVLIPSQIRHLWTILDKYR